MTKTGPNDNRCIVWAQVSVFLTLISFIIIITSIAMYIKVVMYEICDMDGGTTKFGPGEGFFLFFYIHFFFILTNILFRAAHRPYYRYGHQCYGSNGLPT